MGAKGIFVKEIETALLERRIDLAVHSLKDLPTELPEGLTLAAVLDRESPFDGLVSRTGARLDELPAGATFATGSLRRSAQVLHLRPDLTIVAIRGNVPSRIEKIRSGYADATLVAVAGVRRLGLESALVETLDAERLTPPMGQGALALETRRGELIDVMARLEDPITRRAVQAERAFIHAIGGGCKTPAGVLARRDDSGGWSLTAMLASEDGRSLMRRSRSVADADDLESEAVALARAMVDEADAAIRAAVRGSGSQ
jgi:hydroxymethylbilane synthase